MWVRLDLVLSSKESVTPSAATCASRPLPKIPPASPLKTIFDEVRCAARGAVLECKCTPRAQAPLGDFRG